MMLFRGKRKYTGFDGYAKSRRAGTQKFVDWVLFLNGGKIKNLGTFTKRDQRGKPGVPSIHGTGRAIDFGFAVYEDGAALADFLVRNSEALGVELIVDYFPRPFGRGWRVDRQKWNSYSKKTVAGAPGGKWIHVELSPEVADDAAYFDEVFKCLLAPAKGHRP
jgi:hypothetical protein